MKTIEDNIFDSEMPGYYTSKITNNQNDTVEVAFHDKIGFYLSIDDGDRARFYFNDREQFDQFIERCYLTRKKSRDMVDLQTRKEIKNDM